jgi:predicted nucleic acid-binding protein
MDGSEPGDVVEAVVDASLVVDFLLGGATAGSIGERLMDTVLHAPAHLDVEVVSALGRIHRVGLVSARRVERALEQVVSLPVVRHAVNELALGAWRRRQRLRLADALYVELAERIDCPLLTTDARLARSSHIVELVAP